MSNPPECNRCNHLQEDCRCPNRAPEKGASSAQSPQQEKLILCPGCGALLSKEAENNSDSYCTNVNCLISGISIDDEQWSKCYCWRELESAKALLDEKEKEIKFGSHLYGTDTPTSDLDLKGIYLPTGRNPVGARIHVVEL